VSIARRSITSISWNVVASVTQVAIGIVRSVVLARLLPVDTFGVYGMATSVLMLSRTVADWGTTGAFLHRSEETEQEEPAAATLLTLKLVVSLVWLIVAVPASLQFANGDLRVALLTLAMVHWGLLLTDVPKAILLRRVVHRRLALFRVVNIVSSAALAIWLACRGQTLWALLSTDIVTLVLSVFFLYVWRPVWRPRLSWSPSVMDYYLRFGSRNLLADALLAALNRVDDLWTGAFLGDTALGFYSRAYAFATYERRILASSVNSVSGGTYAELANKRKQLSQAFFRTNAFLVRSAFLLGGLIALVAPELIQLLLGPKWLPMLTTFRLMLVFTLLDPIKVTVANLFVAVGRPEKVVQARAVQLAVMIAGLFALGPPLGIEGVALAVDAMLVAGIAILLWQAREYVDFSAWTLFVAPTVALVLGMLLARAAIELPGVLGSPWRTGAVKIAVFITVHGLTLWLLERRQLMKMVSFVMEEILA
jgi:O-antigen/teichoic acid export membrane protein